ncbi:MAG: PAS domain S-box protein [Bacteroidota bacterium]
MKKYKLPNSKRSNPIKKTNGSNNLRDLANHKDFFANLARSKQQLSDILENITDAFFILDDQWRFIYINHKAERLWKQNKDELIAKIIWETFPHTLKSNYYQQFQQAQEKFRAVHFEDFWPTINRWVEVHAYPSPEGLSVYLRDISERKLMETSLTTERELLLVTLRSIGDGVIATDKNGKVILINKTAERLSGWSQKEAFGKPLNKVFYVINDDTSQPYEDLVAKTISDNKIIRLDAAVLISKDLKEIYVNCNCAPIKTLSGENIGVVMVFQDITAKLRTDSELIKTEKMESLGILAGGIAHDFNNLLAGILANLQLAQIKMEHGADIKKYLKETIETTRKASELTKQLLTFSKGGAPVKQPASIADLIKDTVNFCLTGSNLKSIFRISEDLKTVEIDAGQISQVLNNIIINAKQAMPKGGVIEVYAHNVIIENDNHYKPGQYVKIIIKDHGPGISKENLSKIFDPFFTTKPNGSGLGLATSYSIIKKHDGYIEVESSEGAGASFVIYLPATESQPVQSDPRANFAQTGNGRILLMDDEETIRRVVGEMLTYSGYQVTSARDGSEAVAIYKSAFDNGQPFDVVIMDLTIPGGMGGQEALSHLLSINPKIKAIVSSGYANDPIIADYQKYGFAGVVIKPYKFDELSEILVKVLFENNER